MKAPSFWSDPDALAGRLLAPIGALVGAVTLLKMDRAGARAGVPVLCVGNPTVGGAGKTPAAQWLAARLSAGGHRPAILARGYGGSLAGPVVVDPRVHGPADVGDEPLLHARHALTVVSRDRPAGAALAVARGASVIVMDDGFQNPSLAKTRTLLVVDGAHGVGNGRVLPAGPLRAPLAAQIRRADALLVIGPGEAGEELAALAGRLGRPVMRGRLAVEPETAAWLADRAMLAFCGIGRPTKFAETLGAAGARNAVLRPFPDHHRYTDADAGRILAEAKATGLPLVTTEKDAVKLKGSPMLDRLAAAAHVVPVRLVVDEAEAARAGF